MSNRSHTPHHCAISAVRIPCHTTTLTGLLMLPTEPRGMVLFPYASATGRHKPRNHYLMRSLAHAGFAVALIDLLTPEEETEDKITCRYQEDAGFLAARLAEATHWAHEMPETKRLGLGFLGVGPAGTATLIAAAALSGAIDAVVSADGRPDQTGDAPARLQSATLLLVSETCDITHRMNETGFIQLRCHKELRQVPGASSLLDGEGLAEVATLAVKWFTMHVRPRHVGIVPLVAGVAPADGPLASKSTVPAENIPIHQATNRT